MRAALEELLGRLLADRLLRDQARRRRLRARLMVLMRRYRWNGPWAMAEVHWLMTDPREAWFG